MKHFLRTCLLATTVFATPSHAQLRALVVGVNDYQTVTPLKGAVADAQAVAAALKEGGASVTLLTDRKASRKAVLDGLDSLLKQAQDGDTLWFSYAGHGAQEPERVVGSEADGQDETLVLADFDPDRAGKRDERIYDNEIRAWAEKADARGLNVIIAFDSCHSGSANRAAALERGQTRKTSYKPIPPDNIPLPTTRSESASGTLSREVFIAAAQDNQLARELPIEGQTRGILSHYLVKALRGEADRDGDGTVSREELRRYLAENVRTAADQAQTPTIDYPDASTQQPAFAGFKGARMLALASSGQAPLRLAVTGLALAEAQKQLGNLPEVQWVPVAQADVVWQADQQRLIGKAGDVLTHLSNLEFLRGELARQLAWQRVSRQAERRPLTVQLSGGDGVYRLGSRVQVSIPKRQHPALLILNLAAGGVVNFLYPLPQDRPSVPVSEAVQLPVFEIIPPDGAERLLVISAPAVSSSVLREARALDGQIAAHKLPRLLEQLPPESEIGLVSWFSVP